MLRRLLICLAFAVWCFLDTWVEYAEGGVAYFARHSPLRAVVRPVVVLELLIAAGIFLAWELCRRRLPHIKHFAFLAASLWPLGIALVALPRLFRFDLSPFVRQRGFWPVALLGAFLPLGFALLHPKRASRIVRGVLLVSWPALLVLHVQAVRTTLLTHESYTDGQLAARLPTQPSHPRVVWIIFDELSQPLTFDKRPAGVSMPEFDRLKAESFAATAAESPSQMTRQSMPALILGEPVVDTRAAGPAEFLVQTPTHPQWTSLRSISNIFDSTRALGLNTAVVGWYHPYGRLLNHSLTECYWMAGRLPPGVEERPDPQNLFTALGTRLGWQFSAMPLIGRLHSPLEDYRRDKVSQLGSLRRRGLELSADPSLGLVLIHLPVPHPPALPGSFGYLGSLATADSTLGELRQAMGSAGIWQTSTVLVSSDHSWRPWLWRGDEEWTPQDEAASGHNTPHVPFLLKLSGSRSGLEYHKPFNTVVTRRVITEVLTGTIQTGEDVARAIERATNVPKPNTP